jgi:glycosyltransferase involved in cell wall biosynthesis
MRILMIWSENLNKPGSGRTHFVHLARELAALGHQVRIVAPGYRPRATDDLGVPVSYVPAGRRSVAAFLLFHLLLILGLPYLVLRYRPQVVYSRGLFHSFLVYVLCRLMGRPYVAEVNSIVDEEMAMRGRPVLAALIRCSDRLNLRWASAFVCVTGKLRAELIRRGTAASRVVALHNGAAVDLFVPGDSAAARDRLGLPRDVPLIGFVGTLAAWQGLDLLVEAAARLPREGSAWQTIIVGDGEMQPTLIEQIATAQLADRVLLRPAVPHDQVALYLQAIDVVVIPIHDPRKLRYGLSVLKFWEALSAGLPVLVPDDGDLGDVLAEMRWPGEYPTGDAQGLASTLVSTMGRLSELRTRRLEIHQRIRDGHSWRAVAQQTAELFARLCSRRRGEAA